MKRNINILYIIFLIAMVSCIDQIPITVDENKNEYLIIDAQLSDANKSHQINLKINGPESTDFQADIPVDDAEIKVIENGAIEYEFLNSGQGRYINQNLEIREGNTYLLRLRYRGILYESTQEQVLPSIPIAEISTLVTTETENNAAGNLVALNFVNIFVNADLPIDENVYLKYRVQGIYTYNENATQSNLNPKICYVNEIIDLDNIVTVKGEEILDGVLRNQQVLRKTSDYRFSQNYCLTVIQERISRESYDFWKLVENEYTRTGDIFENPPGVLRGNISEKESTEVSAIGLFSVSSTASMKMLITPAMAGNPRSECSGRPSNRPSRCINCQSIFGSSLIKPDCF